MDKSLFVMMVVLYVAIIGWYVTEILSENDND